MSMPPASAPRLAVTHTCVLCPPLRMHKANLTWEKGTIPHLCVCVDLVCLHTTLAPAL